MADLNWEQEHEQWERQMRGLVRALALKELRRAHRPWQCYDDTVLDSEIISWMAWRSLKMRGLEPAAIGIYAISLRCVRQVMAGRAFRPLQARGDRSWADSIYNRRNGVNVRSGEDWALEGAVGDGQEESDLQTDFNAWRSSLDDDERALVEALVSATRSDWGQSRA